MSHRLSLLRDSVRSALADVPLALRDTRTLRRWLLTAHKAQAALVLLLVLGWLAMPPLRDSVLHWVFPDKHISRFFGLATQVRRHPAFSPAQIVVTTLYWITSIALVGLALLLHLPTAWRQAHARQHTGGSSAWAGAELAANANSVARPSERTVAARLPTTGGPVQNPATAPQPALDDAMSKLVSGRYRLGEELGRGAMGVVYRAHDEVLGRDVALKALPSELVRNAELELRFQQEARALARLMHPHIVQVFDLTREADARWIAMELVDGGSLAQVIERGPLSQAELVRLALQIAGALAYSHQQGVIHRDLKPANMLLTRDGAIKITDFGLAKLANNDSSLTRAGALMGSPAYMSPEQASGQPAGPETDIYSLGVTLYEAASGRTPFTGTLQQVLLQHVTQQPPALHAWGGELVAPLEQLIMAMLAKQPQQRPSMSEVSRSLEAVKQQASNESPCGALASD